jgi:hypothetical protein
MPEPGSGRVFSPSVAVAPNGDVAFLATGERYEIQRISATGQPLPPVVRDIPRVRRSPEEIAASQQRQMVGSSEKSSQERQQTGGSRPLLPRPSIEYRLHAATDGLRYDDAGRLWVKTMRADGPSTVFDVFAASGQYLGEVTVPMKVETYALAGRYLATAGIREDNGIPVVVLWTVS